MSYLISWITIALFNVSMLSGLFLAFFYKPSLAYESVQRLTYLIPYGDFIRELHYFSSQAFVVFTLLHIVVELIKIDIRINAQSWIYSILATLFIFLLMFTGYVLKADLSGLSAGEVAISLMEKTPILEQIRFLLEDESFFIWKFYLWHILFLPIFLTFFIYKHTNSIKTKYLLIGFALSVALMSIFTMPKDLDIDLNLVHLSGPWFFRGAENLLAFGINPIFVNSVILIPFILILLYFYFKKYRKVINILLLLWTVSYAYLITL